MLNNNPTGVESHLLSSGGSRENVECSTLALMNAKWNGASGWEKKYGRNGHDELVRLESLKNAMAWL